MKLDLRKREKQFDEMVQEQDNLRSRVTNLDVELTVVIQAKGDAEGGAYVCGFSNTVGMFKKNFPNQNMSFLDKALQGTKRSYREWVRR